MLDTIAACAHIPAAAAIRRRSARAVAPQPTSKARTRKHHADAPGVGALLAALDAATGQVLRRSVGWTRMRWRAKEPFNSYSHMLGVVLSIVGLVALVVQSQGNPWRVVGFSIYGVSLVLLYSASTIYHWLHVSPRTEDLLRRFDHIAIFVLIAGSYTPVCLVTLRGGWGWGIFGVVWALAIAGIFLKVFFEHLPPWPTAALYVGMGWLAVVAIGPLVHSFPPSGLLWMVAGGLAYTAGAVIYAIERPDPFPEVFGHHEIFHIFVLAGSVLHFVFMAAYVLPSA
jgi:hemolysin III